ncbi:MAG: histidine phosphatase family protein [Alphaproteobacteria bacterium]
MGFLQDTTTRRRIYLMRHGHVDYFQQPADGSELDTTQVNLTERGQGEAKKAGIALKDIPFDKAVCSGYPRTFQTAQGVLSSQPEATRPTLEIDPDLVELHSGNFNIGHLLTEHSLTEALSHAFDEAQKNGATMGDGGEAFADAMERSARGMMALINDPDWTQALVVAHEGINRVILSWAAAGDTSIMGAFEQDLACFNILDVDHAADGSLRRIAIKAVNVTGWNPSKDGMNRLSLEEIFHRD